MSLDRRGSPRPAWPKRGEPLTALPDSIDAVERMLAAQGYVAARSLATVLFLSLRLGRPLFLEGEAGVGKTEIAKVLAAALGRRLIRLQCYEGLDASSAVYEWNFAAQMIAIRTAEAAGGADRGVLQSELFTEDFLIERPLLAAMRPQVGGPPILLIDELDRTDEPFEAYLLEALSEFQVTIPELGTVKAPAPPIVILTSNRTREVHDALKRRCLYHWVDYPDPARELQILSARCPEAQETLSREIVAFVQRLRTEDLFKKPGVAETIDWAKCLLALDVIALTPEVIADTLGAILKYQDDIQKIQGSEAKRLLDEVRKDLAPAG
ncbi:MoxR-like ATPase [Gemmobacter aquatilis]|uniref:MoxR-like ATPase n=2 Tax=Gemmobacter aquatilis TaxID=933059 RepID=A0A1H8FS61_9RHOB|nr:MoxR-like ATPase [Gemmobacter aquatilis]